MHADAQLLVEGHTVHAFELLARQEVQDALEVAVDDEDVGTPVALRALPTTMLKVCLQIVL